MTKKVDVRKYRTSSRAARALSANIGAVLFNGDCLDLIKALPDAAIDLVVTSPPYCMGMEYEKSKTVDDFVTAHKKIFPEIIRVVKPGGSICWQVGNHVSKRGLYPLDFAVFSILDGNEDVVLRNRIVWTFAHGLHSSSRFSGRHETLLWYTKGDDYHFDLDAVRVPQKYPGKRHYKGPLKGEFSGNPLGKNPGDVWEIPNVKGNHIEKLEHPCQFPVALVQRLVRSLCPDDGVILDPFMGVASAGVAAIVEGRRFIGSEIQTSYTEIAFERLKETAKGRLKFRPVDRPIFEPDPRSRLAVAPPHFFPLAAE